MRKDVSHLVTLIFAGIVSATSAVADPVELYRFSGTTGGDFLGRGLACVGPFGTGSTTADIAIGLPGFAGDNGRITGFRGSDGTTSLFALTGANSLGEFGYSIARVGDLNADGLEDIAVGSPGVTNAAVYFSPDAGTSLNLLNTSAGTGSRYGASVAGLFSDANSNSVNDVIVTAPRYTGPGGSESGFVSVQDGATGSTIQEVTGSVPGARLGTAVDSIEDRDADGVRDIVVSAPFAGSLFGEVYVYSSVAGSVILTISGNAGVNSGFGASLTVVPDVNADGVDDILVGAPFAVANAGHASLFSGATGATLCIISGSANSELGTSVAAVGDQNSDGAPDFAIGAPQASSRVGTVDIYTYTGSGCALLSTITGTSFTEQIGISLAGISGGIRTCDLNGDSLGDFGVGTLNQSGGADAGGAIFFAAATPTPTPTATPTPTVTSSPSVQLPTSAKFDYRISLNGTFRGKNVMNRDPAGRCKVTLYGRRTSSNRKNRGGIVTVESRKAASEVTVFSGGPLSKPLSEAPGRPYLFHMIVKNECKGGKVFYSNVYSRRLTCGALPPVTQREWEVQLPRKVR